MSIAVASRIDIRKAMPEDAAACGGICFDAFSTLNQSHGFPCDFPAADAAVGLLSMLFANPGFHCVVAEVDGRIVGSNCVDERSIIAGLGPITVTPGEQNRRVGRRLMQVCHGSRMGTRCGRHPAGPGGLPQPLPGPLRALSASISGNLFRACRGARPCGPCPVAR